MATRFLFEGRKAVVTGGGKGIGRSIVDALCKAGADKVYAVSRTASDLEDIEKTHKNATGILCDVSCADSVRKSLKGIDAPHMLVNNAGITGLQTFLETDVETYDSVMNINCRAAMVVAQECAKKMIDAGIKGSIVNVSSMGAEIGLANHTAYCTSKGAINQLTRVMALELGEKDIRVNAVEPTIVFTDMGRMAWSDPVVNKPMRDRIPLGKFCEVEDVVDPIMFLLSDNAAMITGAMLPIEGGFLASCFSMKDE
mmetsp:Transcript_4064/g.7491  ORF Transcript_4064/g.7491 Transcript_4064/m.7491 type:complete len:255 (-) Transcript_4064:230-994(-)